MPANFGTEDNASQSAIRIRHATRRVSVSLAVLLPAVIALNVGAAAQTAPARPDRGINPGGSYSISDIENINMTNGNVGVSIPLASLPPIAGGKLGNTIRAVYNSKLWDVVRRQVQPDPLNPSSAYQTNMMQLSDVNGGWIIGGGYSIYFFESHDDFDWPLLSTDPEYDFLASHVFLK